MRIQFLNKENFCMTLYEKIYSKKNTKEIILEKSDEWIKELETKEECVEKHMALAHIYYMRELYVFDCTNAEKACECFNKIPDEYYNVDCLSERIDALKLCYRFKEFLDLSKQLLERENPFEVEYLILRELVDDSIVADGIMTKEEYYEFKEKLKELLTNECISIDRIIP